MDNKDEEIEMLDFEPDEKVSNEIDEMLDFVDLSDEDDKKNNQITELLDDSHSNAEVEISLEPEKLEEYKPTIKDFNIKSAKVRKILKKSMLYVIIVMLLGFEFFINKTGEILDDLRVYASDNQPIRIEQNEKYGYIDSTGKKIVNPKYTYAENYIKGYAIVKNSSNLPLIIDKGGREIYPSGAFFSIYRAGTDIIASKVTKKGLKYGILDQNLKIKTEFMFDSISYVDGVYTYVDGNTVGIINNKGKKIYKYKLLDKDDKKISVTISKVTDADVLYAVVKVNSSSQIININTGKIVTKPTLNEVVAEENNVFYEITTSGKKYMYIMNDNVALESIDYSNLSMDSINAGVLRAYTNNYKYEYISTKTFEQVSKKLNSNQVYFGENIFMFVDYNYNKSKKTISLVKGGEVFKTIEEAYEIVKPYKNGIAIIKYEDNTFGYLNENGNLITNIHFTEANEFDKYGDAVAKTEKGYGVINKNGKIIIPFENVKIKMASDIVKINNVNEKNIFYAVMKDNRYLLYNSAGKKVQKTFYNDVIFNEQYPILKVATELKDAILVSSTLSEINLTSFNNTYEAYENYIILKNEYYNYYGKLIYKYNGKNGE